MMIPVIFITGVWGIGLAIKNCNLQKAPLGTDTESWVLRHDGHLYHNGEECSKLTTLPTEGDIMVSCTCLILIFYAEHYCSIMNIIRMFNDTLLSLACSKLMNKEADNRAYSVHGVSHAAMQHSVIGWQTFLF